MHLKGLPRKLMYDQWQEILKKDKVHSAWGRGRGRGRVWRRARGRV
jgi:hypothetical protein